MSKKILIIEDNLEVRENTAEILELADFEVLTAENGKVGVALAKEQLPDLILCDIMMPELDGYGVLHILSKNEATATIPFIFLTAKAEKSDFRKGMSLGADDYLTKPFDEMELMEAIESRLKKSDAMKAHFEQDINGLNQFIDAAKKVSSIESVMADKRVRTYKKKETIYHEDDYCNHIYFINSGKIKTFKINDDGKEFITGLHHSGDFLAFQDVLKNQDYSESAAVLDEAEICSIYKVEFLDLMYSNKEVADKFIKMLSNNLIEKERELIDLAYNTVRKRVADALVKLKEKYQEEDSSFEISISRSDLASMVGTAQESVIRILSEFKDEELIEVKGSTIKLLKPEKIAAIRF